MQTITHQIRWAALGIVCLLAAHLRADAQVRAFSFSEKGRLFLTSPTAFFSSGSAQRGLAIDAQQGTGKFVLPKARLLGTSITGQYFFHGIFLGYQVAAGLSPKSYNTPSGSQYTYETRDYTGEAGLSLGLCAVRIQNLSIIPSYGVGYGVWATHLYSSALPENGTGIITKEDQEASLWTAHVIHDAALQSIYVIPSTDGGSRFAFGLRAGYKTYSNAAVAKTVLGDVTGDYAPIGMRGFYGQVSIGVGFIRSK